MQEAENLSLKAARMAIREYAGMHPELADKQIRSQLPEHLRQRIYAELTMIAEMYEASLIQEIRSGHVI